MIAEFMHFYNYTLEQVLDMYAVTFYALVGAMTQIEATNRIHNTVGANLAFAGGSELKRYIQDNEKVSKGTAGILEEVRLVRKLRKNRNK